MRVQQIVEIPTFKRWIERTHLDADNVRAFEIDRDFRRCFAASSGTGEAETYRVVRRIVDINVVRHERDARHDQRLVFSAPIFWEPNSQFQRPVMSALPLFYDWTRKTYSMSESAICFRVLSTEQFIVAETCKYSKHERPGPPNAPNSK